MYNLMKRIVIILFINTVFFTTVPVFSQITYEWELKKDVAVLEDRIPMVFTIVETDPGDSNNNVHQIQLNFRTYIAQSDLGAGGGGLYFHLYLPGAVTPTININNPPFDGDPAYINDYGGDEGFEIRLAKIIGEDRWRLRIRYKPLDPAVARGVIGDSNHPSTSDTFIFVARNVTLPDPLGDDWLSKVDMTVATRTRAEFNAGDPFGGTGLSFDPPPDITITAPAIPASGILAYNIPVGAAAPLATDTFTASVTNDVPAEITGEIWNYTPPVSSACTAADNGGGVTWAAKDFDCLGFQEMIFQVEETIVGSLTQKAIKYIPVVLTNPPAVSISVTNPPGTPPVGLVPQSLSVSGIVTDNDPLPEPDDHDPNGYDHTNIRWEIKKDGSAIIDTFSTGTLTPPAHNIGESGRYRVTCRVDDDYGFEGSDYVDILITPVENMVFPPTRGVPFDSDPPEIDGVLYRVDGDGDGIYDPADPDDIIENGWTGSYRLTYQNGTIPANVAFQGIRQNYTSSDYLYLSYEVRNDQTFDDDDVIVLNFSADTTLATHLNDRRIFIFPVHTGIGASDGTPADSNPADDKWDKPARHIEIYEKDAGGNWSLLTSNPATIAGMNIDVKAHSWQDGSVYSWDVEIQIPTNTAMGTASWIDLDDNFLFYFDVIRINSTIAPDVDGYAVQFSWPRRIPLPFDDLVSYPFPVQLWGSAFKTNTPLAKGVSITSSSDIGIDAGLPYLSSLMSLSANNRFVARLTNTSERVYEDPSAPGSAIGDPIPAEDVVITFKIAHWGIIGQDGDWRIIPSTNPGCPEPIAGEYHNNPTCEQDVPAEAGVSPNPKHEFYVDWVLSPTDSTYYAGNEHQCIKVEIDSFADTNILQTGVARNMDFDPTSSEFSRVARIDTKGFGEPPAGNNNTVLLIVSTKEWARKRGEKEEVTDRKNRKSSTTNASMDPTLAKMAQVPDEPPPDESDVTSYLNYIVNGYMETGHILIINQRQYKIVEPMGSFGYVVTHDGEVEEWEHDIDGADKIADNTYKLEIPAEKFKVVTTHIESVESVAPPPTGFCFSLHGGYSIPLSTFANTYDPGPSGMIDIGYQILPNLYILGLFAYHYFPAKPAANEDDLSMITAALNLKYFVRFAAFKVGIGAGPVIYIPDMDFTHIDFGYDAKISIDYIINRMLTLEIGAIYYSTFDQRNWFLQNHAGIILHF